MKVSISGSSNINVKVRQENGRITVTDPVTIKTPISSVASLRDIGDVRIIDLEDGAILRYNANTETYDVAPANTLVIAELTANTLTLVNPLQSIYGGTGFNLYTAGDILYASNSTHLAKLAIGSNDSILTVNNGILQYSNIIDGGFY